MDGCICQWIRWPTRPHRWWPDVSTQSTGRLIYPSQLIHRSRQHPTEAKWPVRWTDSRSPDMMDATLTFASYSSTALTISRNIMNILRIPNCMNGWLTFFPLFFSYRLTLLLHWEPESSSPTACFSESKWSSMSSIPAVLMCPRTSSVRSSPRCTRLRRTSFSALATRPNSVVARPLDSPWSTILLRLPRSLSPSTVLSEYVPIDTPNCYNELYLTLHFTFV